MEASSKGASRRSTRAERVAGTAMSLVALFAGSSAAQVTSRVSLDSGGRQAEGSSFLPSISADGRFVAFDSIAANLVDGDTNLVFDVFVRDRILGTTERVSVDSAGAQEGGGRWPSISADGRFVAFVSSSANLVRRDTNGTSDVFVRDRLLGTTERVSVSSSGEQGRGDETGDDLSRPSIAADGRFVAFSSFATNLVGGDTNESSDIFVRDRLLGSTERVSVGSIGVQANNHSYVPSISADGRFVAFRSFASNLVSGDTNGRPDIFVRDRQLGTTERVSVDSSGTQGDDSSGDFDDALSISADGRYVVFSSLATNLVNGDTNAIADIFVRDRLLGTTERVSVDAAGHQGNARSLRPSISADGRYVAFDSLATNLVDGDTNQDFDVFVRDRQLGATERVSVDSAGAQGEVASLFASISADGRCVALESYANDLVIGDTNGSWDIFVRDRLGGPSFASLCDPSAGGVLACPCANPPIGRGRGCDNSSATGGANLSAAGGTYLSSDSLVFTANGEPPTAMSVLVQGTMPIASGAIYGQGVRCVGGRLLRLFAKAASGGSLTVPEFDRRDPTVSARSSAKGDVIQPGQGRWYLLFYRDPIVLGGCPSGSTFNATQTGQVTWSP